MFCRASLVNMPVEITKYYKPELHITIGSGLHSAAKIWKNCITSCDGIRKCVGLQHSDTVQGPKILKSAHHFLIQYQVEKGTWQYK